MLSVLQQTLSIPSIEYAEILEFLYQRRLKNSLISQADATTVNITSALHFGEVNMATRSELMQRAVELARLSQREEGKTDPPPLVGAVVAKDGVIVGEAFRGKSGKGHHAEFALLQHELKGQGLEGATLYTTLEPCTIRGPDKTPCANWIILSGITEVVIGMIDPNRTIQGDGYWLLSEHGIKVSFFDQELIAAVASDNEDFIRFHRPTAWLPPPELRRLDDWYYIINSIYLDRNSLRAPAWMFSHLVEMVGGLSTLASDKTKPGVDPKIFIAKCLGWWFALCGVVGVRSVMVSNVLRHLPSHTRRGFRDRLRATFRGAW